MCQLTPAKTDTVAYITEKKIEPAMSLLDLSSLLEEGVELDDVDIDAAGTPQLTELEIEISGLQSKLAEAYMYIATLKVEDSKSKDQNEYLANMLKKMKANTPDDFNGDDDDKVDYYTGLQGFVTLMVLFNLVASEISEKKNSSLNKFRKFIVTLMRLRLNLPIVDLSYRFGVYQNYFKSVFRSNTSYV